MEERIMEIVAIGASVSAHCQPCLAWHVKRARELGVAESDVQAAMGVGFKVQKGAEKAMLEYADKVVNPSRPQAERCCSGDDSTCCD